MISITNFGTLWNGIAKMILTIAPQFIERLGIPADHEIGFVMSFGKPTVKYHRTIERGSAPVNFIKNF